MHILVNLCHTFSSLSHIGQIYLRILFPYLCVFYFYMRFPCYVLSGIIVIQEEMRLANSFIPGDSWSCTSAHSFELHKKAPVVHSTSVFWDIVSQKIEIIVRVAIAKVLGNLSNFVQNYSCCWMIKINLHYPHDFISMFLLLLFWPPLHLHIVSSLIRITKIQYTKKIEKKKNLYHCYNYELKRRKKVERERAISRVYSLFSLPIHRFVGLHKLYLESRWKQQVSRKEHRCKRKEKTNVKIKW